MLQYHARLLYTTRNDGGEGVIDCVFFTKSKHELRKVSARCFETLRCHKRKASSLLHRQEQGRLICHANTEPGLSKSHARIAKQTPSTAGSGKQSLTTMGQDPISHPG